MRGEQRDGSSSLLQITFADRVRRRHGKLASRLQWIDPFFFSQPSMFFAPRAGVG